MTANRFNSYNRNLLTKFKSLSLNRIYVNRQYIILRILNPQ